jgi:hypothetical protein
MEKKGLYLISLICFLLYFVNSCKPYDIRFDEEIHDFGQVESGEDIIYSFVFTNTGTRPLIIEQVKAACPCTKVSGWDNKVSPGKKGKIPVTFNLENYNGETAKVIFVTTNVPGRKSIQLTLKGMVIIPIEIIPLSSWLGEVEKDTKSFISSFEIKNNLDTPLEITEIIPPQGINIEYSLVTIVENEKYQLDYTVLPPFIGSETVSHRFTLKTNNKKYEYLYPQFHYHIPLPVKVFPARLSVDTLRLADESLTLDIDVKISLDVPVSIIDVKIPGQGDASAGRLTWKVKELVKDKYYQISVMIPKGYLFKENEKPSVNFRVKNDPENRLYSIPIEPKEKT